MYVGHDSVVKLTCHTCLLSYRSISDSPQCKTTFCITANYRVAYITTTAARAAAAGTQTAQLSHSCVTSWQLGVLLIMM
jgi:hypothetical protein